MQEALRVILPVYFVAFFGLAFLWRSIQVRRMTGRNPYVIGKADDVYGYIGRVFRVTMVFVLALVLLFAASPDFYRQLGAVEVFENDWWRGAGVLLLAVSLVLVAVAQKQMGASWRIGVDREHRTELVDTGLFGVSRNPIFLALRLTLVGFFLTVPSWTMLIAVLVGEVSMQVQVRLEEQHLRAMHGDVYERYCERVRRWI
jgi:protein-S-isoprenylcysteine O-methyltransferase Ste14